MQFLRHVMVLIGLLWSLAACSSMPEPQLYQESISVTATIELNTSTPVHISGTLGATTASIIATITPTATDKKSESWIATPTIKATQEVLCSPLEHETLDSLVEIISDPYNPPPPGRDERHHGVDYSYYHRGDRDSIQGEVIQTILPGIVRASIADRLPYGNMVIIETPASLLPESYRRAFYISGGESLYHLYAHMYSAPLVRLGEEVICGQKLGEVGKTGYNIVNPHLHLETRIGPAGAQFNEMAFYTTSASITEMETYKYWRTSGEFRHFDPMSLFAYSLSE